MNQKKQKREKAKLIDQAKIVIELSKSADTELNKLNLIIGMLVIPNYLNLVYNIPRYYALIIVDLVDTNKNHNRKLRSNTFSCKISIQY